MAAIFSSSKSSLMAILHEHDVKPGWKMENISILAEGDKSSIERRGSSVLLPVVDTRVSPMDTKVSPMYTAPPQSLDTAPLSSPSATNPSSTPTLPPRPFNGYTARACPSLLSSSYKRSPKYLRFSFYTIFLGLEGALCFRSALLASPCLGPDKPPDYQNILGGFPRIGGGALWAYIKFKQGGSFVNVRLQAASRP